MTAKWASTTLYSVNIRGKIILVVLPLIVTPLLFAGLMATLLARNGITGVATQFLQFKAEQIETYANGQWDLLVQNGLEGSPEFVDAAEEAIATFASSVVRSDTEAILGVRTDDTFAFRTQSFALVSDDEASGEEPGILAAAADVLAEARNRLAGTGGSTGTDSGALGSDPQLGWTRIEVEGEPRVGFAVGFQPLGWTIYVTELEAAFYASTFSIINQVGIVLAVSVLVSIILLFLFSDYLTRPLRGVADAMTGIIETNDLSKRVDVLYKDETGRLAHTFNLMTEQLDGAYEHIKRYAMRAEGLRIKEHHTRTMFQKYVPTDVIDQFIGRPEGLLVGENRVVSILFSDIREFTTISEMMEPDVLVQTLNKYFTVMVDTIMDHNGIVDKYIGDAIMALFGTPKQRGDDAEQSAYAALDMIEALKDFNVWQEKQGIPPFRIGVGLNYGVVTVGNIGTEKKLDYTVIGDMVNVASRLEGLTKKYKTSVVVSDSVREKLERDLEGGRVFARLLDTVQVKGRSAGLKVYGVARGINAAEQDLWDYHNRGMERFYEQDFAEARKLFLAAASIREGDVPSTMLAQRCEILASSPPGPGWNGIVEMTEK